jgi:opacity protein-like surface antigen
MKKIVKSILIVMVAVIISAPALAEKSEDPKDFPWKRGYLSLGAYFATMDSAFLLGESNLGIGIELDVEEFLGLDTSDSSLRIDAGYRFGETMRHKVDFSWFKFNREGSKYIDEQIEVPPEMGGGTLGPGDFSTKFNFEIYKIKYEYSFVFDERVDLNAGLGLYIMPVEIGVSVVSGGVFEGSMREDITAPLPVFSLGFDFAITPKWMFRQQLELFYLELGDFTGGITSYNVALEWLNWKNVGIGLGLDSMRVRVEGEGSDYPGIDFHGDIKFSYFGAQLYLKVYF